MDQETKQLIVNIADIQLEALNKIKQNPKDVDHDLLIKLLQIKDEEILEVLESKINFFTKVKELPSLIKLIDEYQLGICTHILFNLEDEWLCNGYVTGVVELWSIFRDIYKKFHPELTLIF